MSIVGVSSSADGLLRVGMQIGDTISETSFPDGVSLGSSNSNGSSDRAGREGCTRGDRSISADSFESGDGNKPFHRHHLKLLALSAELMRPPSNDNGTSGKKKESPIVHNVGLVEEARNRRRGRKERCVHWDRVRISGREFPLQRADTSIVSPTPSASGAASLQCGGRTNGGSGTSLGYGGIADTSDPSYQLVGHSTCDMCLMTFESSSVSGVITMKRILKARQDWGLTTPEGKTRNAAASKLYNLARLCVLCSQFFCSKTDANGEGDLVPRGVGRSEERVSLTLESMASNKPLPGKTSLSAKTFGAQPLSSSRNSRHQTRQEHVDTNRDQGTVHDNVQNFRLDELIADDHFVVTETDLARQPGATATQSSTADGMGADVCMGFPASKRPRRGGDVGRNHDTTNTVRAEAAATDELSLQPKADDTGTNTLITATVSSSPVGNTAARRKTERTPNNVFTGRGKGEGENTVSHEPPSSPLAVKPKMSPAAAAAAELATARICSRTRREDQPWWEVDLGGVFPVRCIRVHHPDRRTEATKAGASPFVDVAPFWIMTAAGAIGEARPEEAREVAIASKRVASHRKVTVWDLGINHFATIVRVQAEGVKSLQLAR